MKIRWDSFIGGLIVGLWFVSICSAEIYRYIDATGTIRFTDNLQDVPEAQRPHLQRLPETKGTSSVPEAPSPKRGETVHRRLSDSQEVQVRIAPPIAQPDILEEGERLKAERNQLDQEYLDLVREQAALTDQRPNVRDHEAMIRYNEQVNILNAKTDAYEERRKAFEQKVDAFNEKLRQYLDRPIEPQKPIGGGS